MSEQAKTAQNRETVGSPDTAQNREIVESPDTTQNKETVESPDTAQNRKTVESPDTAQNREPVESPETVENRKIMLKIENVTMQFGGVVAVDNLNMEIREGEIVALIGPNGAGKTTAFNVVTGVYQPTNGAVWFRGEKIVENHPQGKMKKLYKGEHLGEYSEVTAPTPDKITRMGMARTFQNIRLWKSRTVFDNILTAKHCRVKSGVFSAIFRLNRAEEAAHREHVRELLETVGLWEARNELASSLPYGKQRRLEIARALAAEPELLLLDEPAAGMNPQETDELTAFIGEMRDRFRLTIFLIEHHMNLVMNISDRVYVLDFGREIAHGVPAEIQNNKRVIDAYLGVADDAEN